jgi:predicted helicase
VFCADALSDLNYISNLGGGTTFPLYLYDVSEGLLNSGTPEVNLNPTFVQSITGSLNLGWLDHGRGDLQNTVGPEDVVHFIYAHLHSQIYRRRYAEILKSEFPRVFVPVAPHLFRSFCKLGAELMSLHLMKSSKLKNHVTGFVGSGEPQVEKVSHSDETVWIDKAKTCGFRGVPEVVWDFHIGGYQVCHKWLKDRQAKGGKNPRPGRVLTNEDIDHYQRIVVALSETIRIMAEIDQVIEAHGGWPDAFVTEPIDPDAKEGHTS